MVQAPEEVAVLYREFATQEELDAQYNLTAMFPEAAARYEAFCWRESESVRSELDHRLDVPFGPTLAEHLDLYPAGENAPVLVYVHGGFWCLRTSKEFGFVAQGPVSEGVATVVTNYDLCPRVTIDEIVRQTRAAVAWAYMNAATFGGDPERIHVAGHSAGGHLVAMLLATDWEGEYGLPGDILKSVTAISGLYDLAPFPYTFLQPQLQLGWDQVLRNSPILHIPDASPPLLVVYGEDETAEFERQSEEYVDAWRAKGLEGEILILQHKNHYDVIDGFLNAESRLCSAILGQMGIQ
jgi:arylformamidase